MLSQTQSNCSAVTSYMNANYPKLNSLKFRLNLYIKWQDQRLTRIFVFFKKSKSSWRLKVRTDDNHILVSF